MLSADATQGLLRNGAGRDLSILVCSYNGAKRLPETLEHIASQRVAGDISWETVVVDNASTDATQEVARDAISSQGITGRVLIESRAGKSFALQTAISETASKLVSIVDDDNSVNTHFVEQAVRLMASSPNCGACAGPSEGVFEAAPPSWFYRYTGLLAIGHHTASQASRSEEVEGLWGAGMVVRRKALEHAYASGFQPRFGGRVGTSLVACEDSEWCLAMRLCGWKLLYDPGLGIRHHMPAGRLTVDYMVRLVEGNAEGDVILEEYREALRILKGETRPHAKRVWRDKLKHSLAQYRRCRTWLLREADPEDQVHARIALAEARGTVRSLWRERHRFAQGVTEALKMGRKGHESLEQWI